ncbi:MAG: prephenate dehydrogenase [Betaproteobacteria bacterium]
MTNALPQSTADLENRSSSTKTRAFVIGLGLMGGSLAMALRASGRYEVDGFDINRSSLHRAAALGALDRAAASLNEAAEADIVVVATPLLAMPSVFSELGRCLKGTRRDRSLPVVTDVGSAKCYVLALAREHLAPSVPFVGGHPMAGSEMSGVEHASADMLKGCRYVLTPAEWTRDADVRTVVRACETAGAVPQVMDPADHDAMVAATSHLPLIIAACLARVVEGRSADHPCIWDLAAGGFRDTTRLSSGDPDMGAGMLIANASRVLEAMREFQREFDEVRRLLVAKAQARTGSHVDGVRRFLAKARASRQAWLERTRFPAVSKRQRVRRSGGRGREQGENQE